LEKLAIEVLTALGERDATIAATEQRAAAALQAMIANESLTVSEAVQWCAGAISQREAARLRPLTAYATSSPRMTPRGPGARYQAVCRQVSSVCRLQSIRDDQYLSPFDSIIGQLPWGAA
jgi:hypothetical protein